MLILFSYWFVFCILFEVRLTGAIFIGYLDKESSDGNDTLWGDALALISAFIYGSCMLYNVLHV